MYRMPSEFIRQKTVVFGPITAAHLVGAFGGFFLSQALGDELWINVVCIALGLALTTIQVKGIVLYQIIPVIIRFTISKMRGETLEPEEVQLVQSKGSFMIRDEDGKPILYREG